MNRSPHVAPPDDTPAPAVAKAPRPQRPLLTLVKVVITAGVLFLALRGIDIARLWALCKSMDLLLLAFAVGYTVVITGLKPLRWLWLLRSVLPQTTYRVALRSTLFGTGARLLLPGKVGELGRVLAVDGLKPLPGVGLTALDLLLEATAAFALAVPGALILGGPVAATAALFLTALGALVLFHPHRVLAPLASLPRLGRLRDRLEGVQQMSQTIGRATLWKGLSLSAGLNLIRFAQLYVIFVALGNAPQTAAVVFFPLIGLADGFPLTVGGLGVREWISLQLLPTFGIRPEAAVAAVFLQFALASGLPGLAGLWIIYRGRNQATQTITDALSKLRSGHHPS